VYQSKDCYSQDDLKATIKITNQNFSIQRSRLNENGNRIYDINSSSRFNKKNSNSSNSNFSINQRFSSNNINNNMFNIISSGNLNLNNNNNNTNFKNNKSSSINTYYSNYQNSNISNNVSYINCNYPNKNLIMNNDINLNAECLILNNQNLEMPVKSPKRLIQYSQTRLNNFISFQNSIRILLVDDEKLIRQSGKNVIKKYFNKKEINYEIEECSDGIECLYKIYEGIKNGIKYDIIITDETMNFMKGSSTAEILRNLMEDNIMYFLKIVMVTSYEISTISHKIKKNLDKIFTKPLSTNTLDLIFN
jgi:CheY-like chemotaxis protein